MIFQQYTPTSLNGIVNVIWEQKSATPSRWKILPSGKVELIFRVGPAAEMLSGRKLGRHDSPLDEFCFLSGLHTRPLIISFDHFHYIGVQMKPIAVKALFGIPLCQIRDYYLRGEDVFSTIGQIEDTLNSKNTFIEKAQWLEAFLYGQIHENSDLHQAINLYKVSEKIIRRNGSIEELFGYSRTHTFRIFNEWFGTSSHTYQKLVQFVQSVHYLHDTSDNLTTSGLNNGYFDQSHFNRSFKDFAGMTPGEYRKQMTQLRGQLPA